MRFCSKNDNKDNASIVVRGASATWDAACFYKVQLCGAYVLFAGAVEMYWYKYDEAGDGNKSYLLAQSMFLVACLGLFFACYDKRKAHYDGVAEKEDEEEQDAKNQACDDLQQKMDAPTLEMV